MLQFSVILNSKKLEVESSKRQETLSQILTVKNTLLISHTASPIEQPTSLFLGVGHNEVLSPLREGLKSVRRVIPKRN